MSSKNTTLKKQRVWEIDALRGLLILMVLAYHLYACVYVFCIDGYYHIDSYQWVNTTDPLHFWFNWGGDGVIYRAFLTPTIRELWRCSCVNAFFVLSGISCMFSRNNLKRALTVLGAGLFVALFTKGLAIWTGDPTRFIRFGVLLCYAFCQLAYVYLFEKRSNKFLLISIIPIFAIGYYIRYVGVPAMRFPIFYIFGVPQIGDQSSDFWPVFPMLGWFLLGVVLGRRFYPEKKTLIPSPLADKLTKPLQWCGRWSGVIYVSHIVVYTAVFCGIGYIFGLL
ncbi:MAG: DUF1624 domain-containing protein [Ruminococcus sp.]|nr:DUF1624 domain-containing protein [Ruminococcus sp.]